MIHGRDTFFYSKGHLRGVALDIRPSELVARIEEEIENHT